MKVLTKNEGCEIAWIVYYNIACVWQKLVKLEQCVEYLEKAITKFEEYWKLTTDFQELEHGVKLVYRNNWKLSKTSQLWNLLMKYRYLAKFNLQLWAVLSQISE